MCRDENATDVLIRKWCSCKTMRIHYRCLRRLVRYRNYDRSCDVCGVECPRPAPGEIVSTTDDAYFWREAFARPLEGPLVLDEDGVVRRRTRTRRPMWAVEEHVDVILSLMGPPQSNDRDTRTRLLRMYGRDVDGSPYP